MQIRSHLCRFAAALLLLVGVPLAAQQVQSTAELVQPSMASVDETLQVLRVDKWKAPGPVKDDAARNVQSIRHDIDATLPGLISTADAAPRPNPAGRFAVYRNLDALYDVLLRVALTGELAAPDAEAQSLDQALSILEGARKGLAESINSAVAEQQQTIAQLQAAAAARAAAAQSTAAPARTSVVDDGPQAAAKSATKTARKKKPAAAAQPQP